MKNTPIKKKLIRLFVGLISLLAVIVLIVNLVSLTRVRNEMQTRNTILGNTVASESSDALLSKTIDQMTAISDGVAEYSNQRFYQVAAQLSVLAKQLESIYDDDTGAYSTDATSPYGLLTQEEYDANVKEDPRTPIVHVKAESKAWDSDTNSLTDAAQAELNLISPLAPAMVQTVNVNDILTACYIGSTAGIQLSADSATSQASVEATDFCGPNGMSSRTWFKTGASLKDGQIAWTDIFQDTSGRGASLTCVTPIYDKTGTLRAVLVCASIMANYSKRITSTTIGNTGESFIVSSDGDIIITSDDIEFVDGEQQYKKLSDSGDEAIKAAETKIMAGENGYATGEYDGRQVLLTYTKIEALPWSFVTLVDMDEVMATPNKISSSISDHTQSTIATLQGSIGTTIVLMVAVIIISLLLVLFLSSRFASNLVKPLTALTDGAKAIGSGNLDTVIEVNSDDETKILAEAFNNMTTDLKEHIKDLAKVTAEKERIGAELNVATRIQASMLPCIFPPYPDRDEFDIYATMTPAKEVGGDFYDFFLIDDDHLALVMADVSGKGVPAALFMVIAKTLLKNSAQAGLGVADVLQKVNNQLCENNEAGMFVTVWMGILEISTGKMRCSNAGHEFPALRRKDGAFELIHDKHGFVLAGMEDARYTEYEMDLHAGDTLFVYTDGVPEATDATPELFGNDRMLEALNEKPDATPEELLPQVKHGIDAFVGDAPQFDDITMLALYLKYTTPSQQAASSEQTSSPQQAASSEQTSSPQQAASESKTEE